MTFSRLHEAPRRQLAAAVGLLGLAVAAPTPEPAEALLARPGWALRAAVEAMDHGHDERARVLLSEISRRHPIVADHADRLRLKLLLRGDDPAAAVAAAREAVTRHADSPLAPRLQAALGDALLAAGDEAGARAAWEVALDRTEGPAERSRILAALGESHERDGNAEAAARAYLRIWREYPLGAEGDLAEARLREIEAGLPRPLRTALDYRERGDALRAKGHSETAILAYDEALARELKPRDRRRAMRSRAHSLFDVRRYDEAAEAYAALAPDPDSAVSRARAIARAGDVPRAVAELEEIADGRWGRTSVYARYIAALLLEDEDELERARRHFERVAGASSHPRYANPALWYLGWTAWRAGDYAEARDRFRQLAERERDDDPVGALQARYWEVRAAEKLGDAGVGEAYAALAREFPLTYYGWRASHRVPEGVAVGRAEPPPLEPGRRVVKPSALARARILLEAGLADEAADELGVLAERVGGLQDRLEVARLLADAGEHHRAQIVVLRAYHEELARGVVPGQEELWWLAWPAAYSALIRELAPADPAIDPSLVSAVMREESGYRPEVTSPAGARGLLQIMPETGHRLAAQLGLAGFTPDDLYRPRVNIQLGAFYLDQLTRDFDGRLEASIASYNAGPTAAARWIEEQPDLENDEWVEAVPYSQTRSYVKRVLRSVHAYRELY